MLKANNKHAGEYTESVKVNLGKYGLAKTDVLWPCLQNMKQK